jgi:hypothetical protein
MAKRARDEGVEVVYCCPSCAELIRIWQAISPYYVVTGPSLICPTCGAVIAVRLEVVQPGRPRPT